MDPADVIAPRGAAWEPWPAHSSAIVAFLLGERTAAERVARRLFRRPLIPCEYAGLAGAPDDAKVEVGASRGMLYLEMGASLSAVYRAHFYVRRAGRHVVLFNDGFHIFVRELRGRGLGLHVFHRQVQNAARLGIRRIETVAGRRVGENGYYTWPRFGFDAALPAKFRRFPPTGLEDQRTVLGLMEREQGRRWWREHGATIRVAFDLAPGSRSQRALSRYVWTKTLSQNDLSPQRTQRYAEEKEARAGPLRSYASSAVSSEIDSKKIIAGGPKTNLEKSPPMSYGNAR